MYKKTNILYHFAILTFTRSQMEREWKKRNSNEKTKMRRIPTFNKRNIGDIIFVVYS